MALTNAQMQAIINAGGSIVWPPNGGGTTITTIGGLPSDAQIAAYFAGQSLAHAARTNPSYGSKVAAVVGNSNLTIVGAITISFAQQVNHYSVQNNSSVPCMVNEDATANAGSYRVYPGGANAIRDVPCTVLNLYCGTAGVGVNGNADLGIVVEGWL